MFGTFHQWLPVMFAILLPVTFLITYGIAVANDHVEPLFPFIRSVLSDAGSNPPESCVFGQLLNIGAVIYGIIVYIRFIHVKALVSSVPKQKTIRKLNIAAIVVGMISAFGMSVLGNFQQRSPDFVVYIIHSVAAGLVFGIGFLYCVLQTVISNQVENETLGNNRYLRRLRIAILGPNVILAIIYVVVFTIVAKSKGPGEGIEVANWTAAHPGYPEHLVSTISEWMAAITLMLFCATFYFEFKQFRIEPPTIVLYKPVKCINTKPNSPFNEMPSSVTVLSNSSLHERTPMQDTFSIHL